MMLAAFGLIGMSAAALAMAEIRSGGEVAVGDPAPAFRLTGSDGKTYSLADFSGRQAVVLAWFPKAFTGG
jgi:peroxiredoxin Q/BCP